MLWPTVASRGIGFRQSEIERLLVGHHEFSRTDSSRSEYDGAQDNKIAYRARITEQVRHPRQEPQNFKTQETVSAS